MANKKTGTPTKDRHQGDKKPDFDIVDEDYLGATEVEEYDAEELEADDGFAHLANTEDDNGIIDKERIKRDPNDATQGRTPGAPDVTSDELQKFKDNRDREEFQRHHDPRDGDTLGRKHHGALRSDPTRMTSSTPQSEKDEIEPGTIIEKKTKDGLVVRRKISEDQ